MTLSMREYVQSDATGLAWLVRSGEVSAAELLDLAKAQLDRLNPKLNAVNLPMLREARERVSGPLQGPLAGVPLLIKDAAQDYAGLPTSHGSRGVRNPEVIGTGAYPRMTDRAGPSAVAQKVLELRLTHLIKALGEPMRLADSGRRE
jgi:Amidase